MPISVVSSGHSVGLASLRSQETKVSKALGEAKNNVLKLNKIITECHGNIQGAQRDNQDLSTIVARHGDIIVRLKDEKFKPGGGDGLFKNLFCGKRYKKERREAAGSIDSAESAVKASSVQQVMSRFIDNQRDKLGKTELAKKTAEAGIAKLTKQHNSLEAKIGKAELRLLESEKKAKGTLECITDFGMIYQSNAGAAAINEISRKLFGHGQSSPVLSSGKVIAEYKKAHGDDIFTRGNKPLLSVISARCDKLSELVETAAQDYYVSAHYDSTSYRGQGMTLAGIKALISQRDSDRANQRQTVYSAGQFFSTSFDPKIADDFASKSGDDVKVIFKIVGNSGKGISVPGGLTFAGREQEIIYSPLARFVVNTVRQDNTGYYHIGLIETSVKASRPLPY